MNPLYADAGASALQYICNFRPEPEGGYTVTCPAFPEIVTYGATLEEARRNAREAIELCLEVYREETPTRFDFGTRYGDAP